MLTILKDTIILSLCFSIFSGTLKANSASEDSTHLLNRGLHSIVNEQESLSPEVLNTIDNVAPKIKPPRKAEIGPSKINITRSKGNKIASPILAKDLTIKETNSEPLKIHEAQEPVLESHSVPGMELTISKNKKNDYRVNELLQQAASAFKAGQFEAATLLYNQALELAPHNNLAMFGLATIYQQEGETDKAKQYYIKLLKLDPSDQRSLNNFLLLVGEQSPEGAIIELKRLENINPQMALIPAQIAMIYSKSEDYAKSIKYLYKALALEPENLLYIYNLAILFDKIGNYPEAKKLYKELLDASYSGKNIPYSYEKINERLAFIRLK